MSDKAFLSDIGLVRKNNEDIAAIVENNHGLALLVADGLGGHHKGEIASRIASDDLTFFFRQRKEKFTEHSAKKFIKKCIKRAHDDIYSLALLDSSYNGIGSTLVFALVDDNKTYIANVGDSRCYTYSSYEGLVLRTKDESYVQYLFDLGKITKAERKEHPQRNILLNAVGIDCDYKHVQTQTLDTSSYNKIILCSDGLYNYVSEERIAEVLKMKISSKEKLDILLEDALKTGGKDNIAIALWEKD